MRKIMAILLASCGLASNAQTQEYAEQGFLFTPHISYQIPLADMYDRFLNFRSVGISGYYKAQSGVTFGLEYDWYFGNGINEGGLFSEITASEQQIIDLDGHFSVVRTSIKGNYITANAGYLFNLNDEKNSGILVMGGAGFMQHKIDIRSSQLKVPQINGEYEKGYDKLAYGLAIKQFVGYQYLSPKNQYHLRAGVEINQGFTKGRRTWDYNLNRPGTDKRFDGTIALKFGVIVPIYTKQADDEMYFID